MKPIVFTCQTTIDWSPEKIAAQILDLANWPEFRGYAFLPGIRQAEYERRTPEVVGSRIRVTNSDGSTHVEEIVDWRPERGLRIRFQEFSPPVSRLAHFFEEIWQFEPTGMKTGVSRTLELHPKSLAARPILWLISLFLRRAIDRHLRQLHAAAAR